ncbi:hypothetical protein [Alistipes sp. D31t1_170403_E11]|uniref:hypothetical protein n=1 Tax=Alistipes sp. D31t1_170403_E11 TaxID=2787128 RepID=UPI001899F586|nr:hypothetical protein [Alistipes sp. D31t1_170403_E11]
MGYGSFFHHTFPVLRVIYKVTKNMLPKKTEKGVFVTIFVSQGLLTIKCFCAIKNGNMLHVPVVAEVADNMPALGAD